MWGDYGENEVWVNAGVKHAHTIILTEDERTSAAIVLGIRGFVTGRKERWAVCHTLTRVESKKLTSAEWETIVDKMVGKGAKLSTDEKILVVEYLAATYGQ